MTRTKMAVGCIFTALGLNLLAAGVLVVPPEAFAGDYSGQCTACAINCPGQNCNSCAFGCCTGYCQGDDNCVAQCCKDGCNGDSDCLANCALSGQCADDPIKICANAGQPCTPSGFLQAIGKRHPVYVPIERISGFPPMTEHAFGHGQVKKGGWTVWRQMPGYVRWVASGFAVYSLCLSSPVVSGQAARESAAHISSTRDYEPHADSLSRHIIVTSPLDVPRLKPPLMVPGRFITFTRSTTIPITCLIPPWRYRLRPGPRRPPQRAARSTAVTRAISSGSRQRAAMGIWSAALRFLTGNDVPSFAS